MREILVFELGGCPHCALARRFWEELLDEHPAWREIPVRVIDEGREPALAEQYDYYYVPTFYVDGVKLHEGVATLEKVKAVLDAALR